MRIIFFNITCFICLLVSCTSSTFQPESEIISISDVQDENAWINNKLELDRIVPIETTDKFLIGNIKRIIRFKNKIIILDKSSQSVFVINECTGRIETHINRKGRGPGESKSILDIAFDDDLEEILVFNDYERLLFFSLDGIFIKDVSPEFRNATKMAMGVHQKWQQ